MRAILMGTAAAMMLAGAAMADDSVLASRIGNTTISTGADGTVVKIYYNADHTFGGKLGAQTAGGTWVLNGNTVCLTYTSPTPLPMGLTNPVCVPVTAHAVGDTWSVGTGDQKRTISLVKGIQ
jgi:hypothetical protein